MVGSSAFCNRQLPDPNRDDAVRLEPSTLAEASEVPMALDPLEPDRIALDAAGAAGRAGCDRAGAGRALPD